MRERREALLARPDDVTDVVREGNRAARAEAARTMEEVRRAMNLDLNL
jgi:tryptophanyl-tRNA synthetase